ncbi:MAG TPA: hypothetical protein VHN98_11655 [Acidimicrobiales bacterium]|nr:hypothetical protein [Acidimicrobiales bacterium]
MTTTSTPPRRPQAPSKRWYRVAAAIAGLGLLAALAWWPWAVTRIFYATDAFVRTRGMFGGRVELSHPGAHTLWIEGDCISCVGNEPREYRKVATVSITGPDGGALRVRPIGANWEYNTGGREGRALYVFDAPRPGAYVIRFDLDTSGRNWHSRLPSNLAVGRGVGLPVRIVRPMAALAGGGITAALLLTLLTYERRRRYFDRKMRVEAETAG